MIRLLVLFLLWVALAVKGGEVLQGLLRNHYERWLESPLNDGWHFYIPPYDFSWGWYMWSAILLFFALCSLVLLVMVVREEHERKKRHIKNNQDKSCYNTGREVDYGC